MTKPLALVLFKADSVIAEPTVVFDKNDYLYSAWIITSVKCWPMETFD